jgi:hypothetical protein
MLSYDPDQRPQIAPDRFKRAVDMGLFPLMPP